MYLNVKYPNKDVFDHWYQYADGVDHRILKQGVTVGDFVIRNGSSGYKVSVWQHDARVYLTPEVDEIRGDGNGMGIWIQLGPKFLIHHGNALHTGVKQLLKDIGVIGDYETKITRLDLAMDLFNISMKDQDLDLWKNGWVGRSKISSHYFNSRTGQLETINIGSRVSPIFVRVYDKTVQAINEGDILYWLDIWGDSVKTITRIEWEIKTKKGSFAKDLTDFALFNGFSARELLNYLLDWGRLCIPDETDTNRNRWEETEFWSGVRKIAQKWADGVDWPTSRLGKEFKPISENYAKFISGVLTGAQAKFGKENPNFADVFEGLAKFGETHEVMKTKAQVKFNRLQNL